MSAPAAIDVVIEGVGLWSASLPGWDLGKSILRGEVEPSVNPAARPAPTLLAPNERRRAPDSVLLAFEIAQQACAMAGRDPGSMPAVFASAYGDLAINDYLCATLVQSSQDLSPTKFHNSVHNAPAGYWAIATGCMASTNAVTAGMSTFGAGLLEAAVLAATEGTPVVYAAYDVGACGPLAAVIPCRGAFGAAFVLAPRRERGGAALRLMLVPAASAELAPAPALLHASQRDNPAAYGLPLLTALALGEARALQLPAGPRTHLHLEISNWQN
jgi:hypothetical protein